MINPDISTRRPFLRRKKHKMSKEAQLERLRNKLAEFEAMMQKGAKVQGTVNSLRKQIADLQQATSDRKKIMEDSIEKQVNELEEQKDTKKEKNKKILLYVAVAVAGFFAYKKFFKK